MKNKTLRTVFYTAISIGVFSVITLSAIVITQNLTKTSIEKKRIQEEIRILQELLSDVEYTNELTKDRISLVNIAQLGITTRQYAYIAKNNDKPVAVILPFVSNKGYSGTIKLLVAFKLNDTILGVRIVEHHETPGLGDKIDISRSNWITLFDNKKFYTSSSITNNTPKRMFDTLSGATKSEQEFNILTGATITSDAVIEAVYNTGTYFYANKNTIMNYNK